MKSNCNKVLKYTLLCSGLCFLNMGVEASNYELLNQTEVSVSINNSTLKELFSQIENQTDLVFIYNNNDFNVNDRVSVNINNESVANILAKVLKDYKLSYTINDRYILLHRKNEQPKIQQNKIVKGQVLDNKGEPIIGANVSVKGTSNGTITDIDGNFSLEVPNNAILSISYIGFVSKDIPVNNQSDISVILSEDTQKLDEVVIVGYGVQKKKDLTGAVSVLEIDDLKDTPVSSVDQMMQGKLSGVNVMPDNMPGGGVAVRIRGFSTIRNNDPLYIIDGVPIEGGMNFLNPNDIESMQVLKDASSASIYGARAANGVVIITTKKGKEGRFSVNLDAYVGVQQSAKTLRMLDAQEYGDMLWMAMKNDGKTPMNDIYGNGEKPVIPQYYDKDNLIPSDNINWVDKILRPAVVQSYNVSFSKADSKTNQVFSLGYFDQQGLVKYTDFKRITGRFNTEYKLFDDHLRIGENLSLSHSWGTDVQNN